MSNLENEHSNCCDGCGEAFQTEGSPALEADCSCAFYFQAPGGSAQDRQWSLCVFDDVIEHAGAVS